MEESCSRFLIAIGASRYVDGEELPSVPDDIRRMVELFTSLRYQVVLPELQQDPEVETVRRRLSSWLADEPLSGSDLVVIYYSGHGLTQAGAHYLLLADSRETDPVFSALSTADLAKWLGNPAVELRHLLVILDTCSAGQGALDIAGMANELWRARALGAGPELWVTAAARTREEADQQVFSEAFVHAVRNPRAGALPPDLMLQEIVGSINAEWERRDFRQRALLAGSGPSLESFIPNPVHILGLPSGRDLDPQQRWQEDLIGHWGPRSRGVEIEAVAGWYFTGRVRALQALVGWLVAPRGDGRMRVVTGGPGSGKSAVLGRLVTLSDPEYRKKVPLQEAPEETVPPEGAVHIALHARDKTLEQMAAELGAAAGLDVRSPALVVNTLLHRAGRLALTVDALDEAREPWRIASELLVRLVGAAGAGADLRLLVGTRRELLPPLLPVAEVLDLDAPGFADVQDLAGYVGRLLTAEEHSPYHRQPERVLPIAEAVARRAFPTFLIARIAAHNLATAGETVDPADEEQLARLPASVGAAFDEYLRRFGGDEERVRDLLEPLAYAEGAGLPWDGLWAPLAAALSGRPLGDGDVRWLLANARSYIAESLESGRSVFRLFHQALTEHLRSPAREEEAHRRFTRTLSAQVPLREGGRDWLAAHSYIRTHLATHAAQARELDGLLTDPRFLLAADRTRLLRAFWAADSTEGREIAGIYRRAADHFEPGRPSGEAAAYLELVARQTGALGLADQIAALPLQRPWRCRWANWRPSSPHTVIGRHQGEVEALAFTAISGRPLLVSGGTDGLRIWNLEDGSWRSIPTSHAVTGLATGRFRGRPVLFANGKNGHVQVLDLEDGSAARSPLRIRARKRKSPRNWQRSARAVACTEREGHLVLASGYDRSVRLWSELEGKAFGRALRPAFTFGLYALAVGKLGQDAFLVAGGDPGSIRSAARIWSLSEPSLLAEICQGEMIVRSLVVCEREGRSVILSGGSNAQLRMWDPESGAELESTDRDPDGRWIQALAISQLEQRPVVIAATGSDLQVFEMDHLDPIGSPLKGHSGEVRALAAGIQEGRAMVFSAGSDGTVRAWDLADALRPQRSHTSYPGPVNALATATLGETPAVVSGSAEGKLHRWRWEDGASLGEPLAADPICLYALATGHLDGKPIAVSGGQDRTLKRWLLEEGVPLGEPLTGNSGTVRAIALVELGGRTVAISGGESNLMHFWDLASGEWLRSVPIPDGYDDKYVLALAAVERNGLRLISGGSDRNLTIQDLKSPFPLLLLGLDDYVRAIAVGPLDGHPTIVFGMDDGGLRMVDLDDLQPSGMVLYGHRDWIYAVAFGEVAGRSVIASGGLDRLLLVRRLDGSLLARIDLNAVIMSIAFGPDSTFVVGTQYGLLALQLGSGDYPPLPSPPTSAFKPALVLRHFE